tara:strand:+ start:407 stop:610 length:204 start_codon:yes stop_codon:yes gene_type:complete
MPRKKSIKKNVIIPPGMRKGVVAQEVTPDFVLSFYEKAKKARSKKKKEELEGIAKQLSKHIGKWLVE